MKKLYLTILLFALTSCENNSPSQPPDRDLQCPVLRTVIRPNITIARTVRPINRPRTGEQFVKDYEELILQMNFMNANRLNLTVNDTNMFTLGGRMFGFQWVDNRFVRLPFPFLENVPRDFPNEPHETTLLAPLKNRWNPRENNSTQMQCQLYMRVVRQDHYYGRFNKIVLIFTSPCMNFPKYKILVHKAGLRSTLSMTIQDRTFRIQFGQSITSVLPRVPVRKLKKKLKKSKKIKKSKKSRKTKIDEKSQKTKKKVNEEKISMKGRNLSEKSIKKRKAEIMKSQKKVRKTAQRNSAKKQNKIEKGKKQRKTAKITSKTTKNGRVQRVANVKTTRHHDELLNQNRKQKLKNRKSDKTQKGLDSGMDESLIKKKQNKSKNGYDSNRKLRRRRGRNQNQRQPQQRRRQPRARPRRRHRRPRRRVSGRSRNRQVIVELYTRYRLLNPVHHPVQFAQDRHYRGPMHVGRLHTRENEPETTPDVLFFEQRTILDNLQEFYKQSNAIYSQMIANGTYTDQTLAHTMFYDQRRSPDPDAPRFGISAWEYGFIQQTLENILARDPRRLDMCQKICSPNQYYYSWDFCLRTCRVHYRFLSNMDDIFRNMNLFPNIHWRNMNRFNEVLSFGNEHQHQWRIEHVEALWNGKDVENCGLTWTSIDCVF